MCLGEGAFCATPGSEGDHPRARVWRSKRLEGNGSLQVYFQHKNPFRNTAQRATDSGQMHHGLPTCRSGISAPKQKVGQWTDAQMHAAIAAVERGAKVRAIARIFDIPTNTLADHVNGRIL